MRGLGASADRNEVLVFVNWDGSIATVVMNQSDVEIDNEFMDGADERPRPC